MPKEFSRARRVEEQIKRELASMVSKEVDVAGLGMVTFTAIDLASDLSWAKVYFTLLASNLDEKEGAKVMNEAAPYLRHCLSKIMTLRSVPQLRFYYDVSIERGNKMEALLDEVTKQDNSSSD